MEVQLKSDSPTGAASDQVMCFLVEAKDGKSTHMGEYFDALRMGPALGVDMGTAAVLHAITEARATVNERG